MSFSLAIAHTDAEIQACFPAFQALRPHLQAGEFLARVRRQQAQGYQILALEQRGAIQSVAGFRCAEYLAWGKILYLDDLSTLPEARGQGFAETLLDWLIEHARAQQCQALHLDSGYARHAAHRLYLRKGLQLSSHHFALTLGDA